MKPTALVVALSLASLPLAFLAPSADAFGWCTSASVPNHQCHSHVVCIGWSWGPGYETCQIGVGPWDCAYDVLQPCLPYLP
jgi:hypothetical protein